jgi:hypothetical protein
MLFLRFICENYDVKKTESLRQYWRQFKMLYDRISGAPVDRDDARDAVRVRNVDSIDEKVESANVNFSIYSS